MLVYRLACFTGLAVLFMIDTNKFEQEYVSLLHTNDDLDKALAMSDGVHVRLSAQAQALQNALDNLGGIIGKAPVIGSMASKIDVKKKRDRIILGGLIGFLEFFIVWYLFG